MNTLDQNLKTAQRRFRAKWRFAALGGVLLCVATAPLVYYSHLVVFRITPPPAASHASVSVLSGVGVALFNVAYLLGNRATLGFASPGFVSRALQVDLTAEADPADGSMRLVEMQAAPARLLVTTAPSLAQTRWHVNGAHVATAEQLDRELPAGTARIEINHEFYRPQTLQLEMQRGARLTRHLDLSPVEGRLNIRSEPAGAQVIINGVEKGLTPIEITAPGGLYRARVALAGHQAIEEAIAITNARATVERDYRLKPGQATARVQALPAGGVLRVNGVVTNGFLLSLAVGKEHVIRYEKAGYLPQSRAVSLTEKQQATVAFALEKAFGEVVIRSAPGAEIRVNGKPMGVTPQTLRLQTVPQKISLARPGHRAIERLVTPGAAALLIDEKMQTELAARLAAAAPVLSAAGGVEMKLFDPRAHGRFTMGAPDNERFRRANEFQREVNLSKPFYVSVTEITEAQFAQYQPAKRLQSAGGNHPARALSWQDAAGFSNWMSARDRLRPAYQFVAGKLRGFDASVDGYRLLAEAEWEWLARVAGRAGVTRFVWGADAIIPKNSGNFADQSAQGSVAKFIPRYHDGFAGAAPAASFPLDAAGLYDMAGNVSEWVHDVYDLRPPAPGQAVAGMIDRSYDGDESHVVKGASFRSASMAELRASFRDGLSRGRDDVGFRVARYLYGAE